MIEMGEIFLREKELNRINKELDEQNRIIFGRTQNNPKKIDKPLGGMCTLMRNVSPKHLKVSNNPSGNRYIFDPEKFTEIDKENKTCEKSTPKDSVQSCKENSTQSMDKKGISPSYQYDFEISLWHEKQPTNSSLSSTRSRSPPGKLPGKNLSSNGLIKFLKSKAAILQTELELSHKELSEKIKELEKNIENSKKMEQQRELAVLRGIQLQNQVNRLENKVHKIEEDVKDRDTEVINLARDLEKSLAENRSLKHANGNIEKRFHRLNEELENTKNKVTAAKELERELRESTRKEIDMKDRKITSLRKQKHDLIFAFKKQLFLIDNLKRQILCQEQAKMVEFVEKEFSRVLDWKVKD